MIYSSRYCPLSRPNVPWLRAFCLNDGCLFGHWWQVLSLRISQRRKMKRLMKSMSEACRSLCQGLCYLHKAAVLERFHLNSTSECSAWEIGLWVRIAVDRFGDSFRSSLSVKLSIPHEVAPSICQVLRR
ncbi:unnamed protein product [Brassica oleracea var. botrytis]|uniref:(rape) hypothetical protein n=1 Tax=Brassica napus TaxID=3708 RepID=A0A816KBZ8_BRANA|nr:unnamed protein product [Brassica napus]